MAWTFDPAAIEADLNWVRLRIGDTDTNDQQLSDETILTLLAEHNDRWLAAAAAARAISAKYARYGAPTEAENFRMLAGWILEEAGPRYL